MNPSLSRHRVDGVFLAIASLFAVSSGWGAPCSYTLAPVSTNHSFSAGSGSFAISAGSSCGWTATTTNTWIQTASSGTGSGSVTYALAANPGYASRTGYILAGGKTFSLVQAAAPLTLATALDAAALTWETSAEYPWTGATQPSYDGLASATSGNRYQHSTTSWLRTELIGPGIISFWWKVYSDVSPDPEFLDFLEFQINGVSQSQTMGLVDWTYQSFAVPAGTNVLVWQYVKDSLYSAGDDRGWVDRVAYSTNSTIPLQQALNTCGMSWTSGGNDNPTVWAADPGVSKDGVMAARSGEIFHGQETWMSSTVSGATNVSFWWRVSSETNSDFLEFYTNSVLVSRVSGEVAWRSNYHSLTGQTNMLTWRFAKNSFDYQSKGADAAWIDLVSVSPAPRGFPFSLQSPVVVPDGNIELTVTGEVGCPCLLEASEDLSTWKPFTNFVTTAGDTAILDLGPTNSGVRFYRAVGP